MQTFRQKHEFILQNIYKVPAVLIYIYYSTVTILYQSLIINDYKFKANFALNLEQNKINYTRNRILYNGAYYGTNKSIEIINCTVCVLLIKNKLELSRSRKMLQQSLKNNCIRKYLLFSQYVKIVIYYDDLMLKINNKSVIILRGVAWNYIIC